MGSALCNQARENNTQEIRQQDFAEYQLNNMTFNKEQLQSIDRSIAKHPSLKKKVMTYLSSVNIADEPVNVSKDQSSLCLNEAPEPITPDLPINNCSHYQIDQQQPYQNLLGGEAVQSIKINSTQKLVFSQNEEVLQQFGEQYSQYSKSHKDPKDDRKQKLLNMNLVDDNLDDYVNFDWKNRSFQLISIHDQNLLRKVSSRPAIKQTKKIH